MDELFVAFGKLKPNYLSNRIQKIIFPKSISLLDVGCGEHSVVQDFKTKLQKSVGVELYDKAIEKSREKNIHNEYYKNDVNEIDKLFSPKQFDAVICIDVVEHLTKSNALSLLEKMETIANKFVIVQTTNGYFEQQAVDGNPYQKHLCGFTTDEFKKLGYKLIGMDGLKVLRKSNFNEFSKDNNFFKAIMINLLDPITRYYPSKCFNLLAYKEV